LSRTFLQEMAMRDDSHRTVRTLRDWAESLGVAADLYEDFVRMARNKGIQVERGLVSSIPRSRDENTCMQECFSIEIPGARLECTAGETLGMGHVLLTVTFLKENGSDEPPFGRSFALSFITTSRMHDMVCTSRYFVNDPDESNACTVYSALRHAHWLPPSSPPNSMGRQIPRYQAMDLVGQIFHFFRQPQP
jgi:hypothetical protein